MTLEPTHDAAREVLPWYANGTLAADERAAVEQHLISCVTCREELAFLQALERTAADIVATAPPAPDTLAATLQTIDAVEEATRSNRARGLVAWWADLLRPGPTRWALAAQLAVIVVLGGLLVSRQPSPGYATLSGGTADERGTRLTVMFAPEATASAMRAAIAAVDGSIVAGPSTAGVYVIQIGAEPDDVPAVEAALERLRTASGVQFAEREP